jgi:mono/diheme cytochrome c family protein
MKAILPVLLLLAPVAAQAQVTYSREISRVFQTKCQICHREGDVAPFALDSYKAAMQWGEDIRRVIEKKIMPPWKPVEGHGSFKDNFGLTEDERRMILDWYKNEAPEGDRADLPEPTAQTGEWQLGDPDVVLRMPELYNVPRRKDVYRCFVVPTGFDADTWLKAVQIVPGNRQVVHHVIIYIDTKGEAAKLDAKDEEPGYDCYGGPGIPLNVDGMLGGWVPGMRASRTPEGVGLRLPKGASLVIQMHYFPAGKQHSDQTKVGLYFAKESDKISRRMVFLPLVNTTFKIPAGNADYEVSASFPVLPGLQGQIHTIVPHMHLLGKRIQVTRTNSFTRANDSLILIDDWDFNWQGFFNTTEPVKLNVLDQLKVSCRFDNSEKNPRNPSNPLKVVGWGEGTEDEMCIAFLGLTFDNEDIINSIRFSKKK